MADVKKFEIGNLFAEEKSFTNSRGELVKYVEYFVEYQGIRYRFYPKADDKKLLNYVLGF